MNYFVHESSYVDKGAIIGEGTKIWHFSHILKNAIIGKNCSLGQNVNIASNVVIGNNVKIQNNVSIYEGVSLSDYVFCGPSCVFTNDLTPRSKFPKGRENYIKTFVKKGASIGANATIICGNTIGEWAMIASGAVVSTDVKPYALMMGVPAVRKGWICKCGEVLNKDLICKCGRKYKEENEELTMIGEEIGV